jgi:two-component system KDP operon response regulator KdpE
VTLNEPDLPCVLVVDDERPIGDSCRHPCGQCQVIEAASGAEALTAVVSQQPELIILDLGLPDMDGVDVTRRLREWTQIPIIIVSVREQEAEKIRALDAGADDYLTKPFGAAELMARIRVALRRAPQTEADVAFSSGDPAVDLARRLVPLTAETYLTPTEYDILRILIQHAGKVITHGQMLRMVWGPSYENETHLLRVNVSTLRRKIEKDPAKPRHVITEPGVGYRLRVA